MDGVLNVNKPSGPTSHDIVAGVRRATGQKRVGHAGTLDPAASGVLLLCLGNATRIVEYLMDWPKSYRATAVFGVETDTEDETGTIVRESDCSHLHQDMVEAVLPRFTGAILQVPPMVSAIHHKGRRLYELARAGEVVQRNPRSVQVYSIRLTDFEPGTKPKAVLDIDCSKGTYIRTLCADIGKALECGAYMASLTRTAIGRFRLQDAVTIETIEEKAAEGRLGDILSTIDETLSEVPSVTVLPEDAARVANGVMLPVERLSCELPIKVTAIRIHGPDGRLLGIGRLCNLPNGEVMLKPEKVFVSTS